MRATFGSLLVSMALAASASAQAPAPADLDVTVEVGAKQADREVTIPVGQQATVKITSSATGLTHRVLGGNLEESKGCSEADAAKSSLSVVLKGTRAGDGWIVASGVSKAGKPVLIVVLVHVTDGPTPTPPGPTPPGPGPTPPPQPVDPLVGQFRDAFRASGFAKAAQLASGLDACRDLAASGVSGDQFIPAAQAALKSALGGEKMPASVTTILLRETVAALPEDTSAPWSDANRTAAKSLYVKLAAAVRAAGDAK